MNYQLQSVTEAGAVFVELAEKHAAEFADSVERHDREGSFPVEEWAAMGRSGLLVATVPAALGGGGLTCVADLVTGIGRLGRGNPSVAIGVAMHTTALWYFATRDPGDEDAARPEPRTAEFRARVRLLLRACVRRSVVMCVATSERGGTIARPGTTAEPVAEGYRLRGRKAFCTNSPVAGLFLVTVRRTALDGPDRFGFAVVGRDTPGLEVLDTWDGLGMRASGSGDVLLDGCVVPASAVLDAGELDTLPAAVGPLAMVGALALAAVFLGIAEEAAAAAVRSAVHRPALGGEARAARGAVQTLVAQNEIDLAAGRALLARAAALLDRELSRLLGGGEPGLGDDLMREVQCASVATRRFAVACVDRALTVSGGAGYRASDPLSRAYRDVRAGPFMQPFSELDAYAYIGRVRLGLDPFLRGAADRRDIVR